MLNYNLNVLAGNQPVFFGDSSGYALDYDKAEWVGGFKNCIQLEKPKRWFSTLNNFDHDQKYYVEESPHNPLWEIKARQMIECVKSIMPDGLIVDAEHIGSTSIPHTMARDCIAINFAVTSVNKTRQYLGALEESGWLLTVNTHDVISLTLDVSQQYQIYFITKLQRQWHMKKAFRDYLRAHPDEACEYAKLKLSLTEKHRHDLDSYRKGKTSFVLSILKKCGYDMFYELEIADKDNESFIGGNLPPKLTSYNGAKLLSKVMMVGGYQ